MTIVAYVQTSLKEGWGALKKNLLSGNDPLGFRGIKDTFGTDVVFETNYVDDFFSPDFENKLSGLAGKQYTCAIVVILKNKKPNCQNNKHIHLHKS